MKGENLMAQKKIGESTRAQIMEICKNALIAAGYDVLQVASGSYGIPAVENEEETAVKVVFQIPKDERNGSGYDVYEDAQAYTFRQNEKKVKAEKKAEKTKKES